MNLDEFIKYLVWVVFFGIAIFGVYTLLGRIGVV